MGMCVNSASRGLVSSSTDVWISIRLELHFISGLEEDRAQCRTLFFHSNINTPCHHEAGFQTYACDVWVFTTFWPCSIHVVV